jgi:Domain of unknown function (DUF1995)
MIHNLFGSNSESNKAATPQQLLPLLPRDVKEAVAACRAATQRALQDRVSRMDIEFPVGTKFGIEPSPKKKSDSKATAAAPTLADLERSNRELARIFVEMFQPVGGGNRIVVAFATAELADAAQRQWRDDATAQARILSMDRRKRKNGGAAAAAAKKKRQVVASKGFAAKLALEIDETNPELAGLSLSGPFVLPTETEVAIFVAPGPLELVLVERICAQVGMGTLVILLNARLSLVPSFGTAAAQALFRDEFQPVFCLAAAATAASGATTTTTTGCLWYHGHGQDWIVARKPAVGPPQTILVQSTRPTAEECQAALAALPQSSVVENALENIANWLR